MHRLVDKLVTIAQPISVYVVLLADGSRQLTGKSKALSGVYNTHWRIFRESRRDSLAVASNDEHRLLSTEHFGGPASNFFS